MAEVVLREAIMINARYARSFGDLLVYCKAQEVEKRIFEISKKFPKEEVYSLTDQVIVQAASPSKVATGKREGAS